MITRQARQQRPPLIKRVDALMQGIRSDIRENVKGFFTDGSSTWYNTTSGWNEVSWGTYHNSDVNYETAAGALDANAIVMACVHYIMTTFPEAPMRVMSRETRTAKPVEMYEHPLTHLVESPNTFYTDDVLWQATAADYSLNGNAYWQVVYDSLMNPVEVWYEPSFSIRPAWPKDGSEFISDYQIFRDNKWVNIPRENVVHFRYGIDPRNPRLGLSKLRTALRAIYTDNEAEAYTAAILKNMGIPGVIISPSSAEFSMDPEQIESEFNARFTGDRRGKAMAVSGPVSVSTLSFAPEQMSLKTLRLSPQAIISALIGIPAVVAGLEVGIEHMIYNTFSEAREHAYEGNIIPTKSSIAKQLKLQLMPRFREGIMPGEYVDWDYSGVRVLQDDMNRLATRTAVLYNAGVMKRSEAREANNLAVASDGSDDTYKVAAEVASALVETGQVGTAGAGVPGGDKGITDPDLHRLLTRIPKRVKAHSNGHVKE